MLKRLGDFMFRSSFSNWLWNTSVGHSWRIIRLAGMIVIAVILTARSIRLYLRSAPLSFPQLAAQIPSLSEAFLGISMKK